MALTKPIEQITPDEAIDWLRSLVFAYERSMTAEGNSISPMSQDAAENMTEDEHAALVVLQRFVDAHADAAEELEEVTLP